MRALAVLALLAGCATTETDDVDVVLLDHAAFAAEVQPILAARCGNPSCHGRMDRPLSLFSPGQYRQDPSRTHLDEPLTDDELEANYVTACVFAHADDPTSSPLIMEPLDSYAGVDHGGGVIFEGPHDREYRVLLRWISRGGPTP